MFPKLKLPFCLTSGELLQDGIGMFEEKTNENAWTIEMESVLEIVQRKLGSKAVLKRLPGMTAI